MREKKSYILGLLLILLLSTGCSVQRMAIRSLGGVLDNSMEALYEEKDLELAEQAIASDLKLLEGLIKSDPGNGRLLLLAAQGFASYALGFVEDESPERARVWGRLKHDGLGDARAGRYGNRLPVSPEHAVG